MGLACEPSQVVGRGWLVDTLGQLEFSGWGEVVPFPGAKKKRRRRCPCRCVIEKTDLLTVALTQLDDEALDLLESRLAWLRRARSLESI